MADKNKIRFGLRNTHYAIVTETTDSTTGEITTTYGTVKPWKGSVNWTADAAGEDTPFYADDIVYAVLNNNSGYTGTFEVAYIPEDIETDVFGKTKDATSGLVYETAKDVKKYIALLTEFQGDDSATRYVFYRCMLSRPSISSGTKTDSAEPTTTEVPFTVTPRPSDDELVVAHCTKEDSAYTNFYSAVQVPSFSDDSDPDPDPDPDPEQEPANNG